MLRWLLASAFAVLPAGAGWLAACPLAATRERAAAVLADVEGVEGEEAKARMLTSMLEAGDRGIQAFCCARGWSGDGSEGATGGVPADGGLCWPRADGSVFGDFARCCLGERLHALAAGPAPAWLRRELASDLQPWAGRRLARAELEEMDRRWGHVFCRFRVRGGKLTTCDPKKVEVLGSGTGGEPWGQYEALARSVRALLALGLLPEGLDFFVSPQIFEFVELPVPVFTKARAVFAGGHVRVPSYELLGPFLDQTRAKLGQPLPWAEKLPRLYWRGGMRSFNACPCKVPASAWPAGWRRFNFSRLLARGRGLPPSPGGLHDLPPSLCREVERRPGSCRCYRHITNRSTLEWSSRARLCELSRASPELLDARLSYVPEPAYTEIKETCRERGYLAEFSRFEDHGRYRYLMSTDGSTIDDTRVYWMLSTGSLVFKQVTPLLPFGVPALEPWRHFIPVREDLGDLLDKVRWARAHDQECKAMAQRSRAFAAQFFTQEQLLHYLQRALVGFASLLEPL